MIGSVLGIAFGTALAAYGEVHNSVVGVTIMFVSEACEAIRLVMTQLLLQGLKMGPFEGVMWLVSLGAVQTHLDISVCELYSIIFTRCSLYTALDLVITQPPPQKGPRRVLHSVQVIMDCQALAK